MALKIPVGNTERIISTKLKYVAAEQLLLDLETPLVGLQHHLLLLVIQHISLQCSTRQPDSLQTVCFFCVLYTVVAPLQGSDVSSWGSWRPAAAARG